MEGDLMLNNEQMEIVDSGPPVIMNSVEQKQEKRRKTANPTDYWKKGVVPYAIHESLGKPNKLSRATTKVLY